MGVQIKIFIHGCIILGLCNFVIGMSSKDRLVATACERNPNLAFCGSNREKTVQREIKPESRSSSEDEPFPEGHSRGRLSSLREPLPRRRGDDRLSRLQDDTPDSPLSRIRDPRQLRELCTRFYPLAVQHCGRQQLTKDYVAKCMGYFRDCQKYIPQGDPLAAIGDAFTSGVALNLGSWEVKGLPFYPINEEGAFGAGYYGNVPFGSWGGGYAQNIGVRDYWSQNFEVGANWIDGRYGYRTGWSMPLVQSLGVEGGGGTDVNVPLRAGKLGTVDVDNHYGVGGYYKHNQHTGVDWRRGEVKSMFGVGVPFAGVGVNTGVGVAFPSVDTWLRP
uniref:Uncharacterized protein n=1 Tax=Panagrolaimus sp. PS1159 TaxID=55785 RepID=A0AC35F314_9BILA